jgi:hypothetical protein
MKSLNNKKLKARNYIKKNNLLLFIFICYRDVNKLKVLGQRLKSKNFTLLSSSKIVVEKAFNNSIYVNFKALTDQTFILISFQLYLVLFKTDLEPLLLQLIAFKLNKNIYNKKQLKNMYSFCYRNNKLLLFKFITANLKVKSK